MAENSGRNSVLTGLELARERTATTIKDIKKLEQEIKQGKTGYIYQTLSTVPKFNSNHDETLQQVLSQKKLTENLEQWSKNLEIQKQQKTNGDFGKGPDIQFSSKQKIPNILAVASKYDTLDPGLNYEKMNSINRQLEVEIVQKRKEIENSLQVLEDQNKNISKIDLNAKSKILTIPKSDKDNQFITVGTKLKESQQFSQKTYLQQRQEWNVKVLCNLFESKIQQKLPNFYEEDEIDEEAVKELVMKQATEIVTLSLESFKVAELYGKQINSVYNVKELANHLIQQHNVRQKDRQLKRMKFTTLSTQLENDEQAQQTLLKQFFSLQQEIAHFQEKFLFYSEEMHLCFQRIRGAKGRIQLEKQKFEREQTQIVSKGTQFYYQKKQSNVLSLNPDILREIDKRIQILETGIAEFEAKTKDKIRKDETQYNHLRKRMAKYELALDEKKEEKNFIQFYLRSFYQRMLECEPRENKKTYVEILNCLLSIGQDFDSFSFPQFIDEQCLQVIKDLIQIERKQNEISFFYDQLSKFGNLNEKEMKEIYYLLSNSVSQKAIREKYLDLFYEHIALKPILTPPHAGLEYKLSIQRINQIVDYKKSKNQDFHFKHKEHLEYQNDQQLLLTQMDQLYNFSVENQINIDNYNVNVRRFIANLQLNVINKRELKRKKQESLSFDQSDLSIQKQDNRIKINKGDQNLFITRDKIDQEDDPEEFFQELEQMESLRKKENDLMVEQFQKDCNPTFTSTTNKSAPSEETIDFDNLTAKQRMKMYQEKEKELEQLEKDIIEIKNFLLLQMFRQYSENMNTLSQRSYSLNALIAILGQKEGERMMDLVIKLIWQQQAENEKNQTFSFKQQSKIQTLDLSSLNNSEAKQHRDQYGSPDPAFQEQKSSDKVQRLATKFSEEYQLFNNTDSSNQIIKTDIKKGSLSETNSPRVMPQSTIQKYKNLRSVLIPRSPTSYRDHSAGLIQSVNNYLQTTRSSEMSLQLENQIPQESKKAQKQIQEINLKPLESKSGKQRKIEFYTPRNIISGVSIKNLQTTASAIEEKYLQTEGPISPRTPLKINIKQIRPPGSAQDVEYFQFPQNRNILSEENFEERFEDNKFTLFNNNN